MKSWIYFAGRSMGPLLRTGDRLLVDFSVTEPRSEGEIFAVGPWKDEGDLVWSAHRALRKAGAWRTKADRSRAWDPPAPLLGLVLAVERDGRILRADRWRRLGAWACRLGPGRGKALCLALLAAAAWAAAPREVAVG